MDATLIETLDKVFGDVCAKRAEIGGVVPPYLVFLARRAGAWDLLAAVELNAAPRATWAHVAHTVARQVGAQAVALLSEAWTAEGESEASLEDAQAWIREHGTLRGFPGAQRTITMAVDTHTATRVWRAAIDDDGTLGPTRSDAPTQSSGLFGCLMPPQRAVAEA